MPKSSSEFMVELLSVGPFQGLDNTTDPFYLQGGVGVDSTNTSFDRVYQSYVTIQGRARFVPTGFSYPLLSLYKFQFESANPGTSPGSPIYYTTANPGGSSYLESFRSGTGFTAPNNNTGNTINVGTNTQFVSYQQNNPGSPYLPLQGWAFLTDGYKIDNGNNVTNWQAAPPVSAPAFAGFSLSANTLIGTYYWRYTYSNAILETSPGSFFKYVTQDQPSTVAVSLSGFEPSTDPQITTINIYRLGGTSSTWILVGTLNNSTTNPESQFIDSTPDLSLTGQSLVLHRDPPANFISIENHKDRIWGFGYTTTYEYQFVINTTYPTGAYIQTGPAPSDLWFSNYIEPWGFDNTDQVLPVGRNADGDIAVGLASMSSLLVCFKFKSTWAIYGDTQSDFLVRKLFDIGCTSRNSIIKTYGLVFWQSSRGIFSFDGGDAPVYLSGPIKAFLDSLAPSDLAVATGFSRYRQIYMSYPTQGVTYCMDIDSRQWSRITWACTNVATDPTNNQEVTATEYNTGNVNSWFAADTDLGSAIQSSYTSRIADSNAHAGTKQFRYVLIEAPIQNATLNIGVYAYSGTSYQYFSANVNLATGNTRQFLSLPPYMSGFTCQLVLSVSSTQKTTIQRAAVYGYVKRSDIIRG